MIEIKLLLNGEASERLIETMTKAKRISIASVITFTLLSAAAGRNVAIFIVVTNYFQGCNRRKFRCLFSPLSPFYRWNIRH